MKKAVIVGLLLVVVLTSVGLGREIVVTTTADSGTGTFRWALQVARSGDTITFDPAVFPPENPATIYPRSELPPINCGNVTVDASNAGVVIDGAGVSGLCTTGLQVYSSHNTIMGLSIRSFSCSGIAVCGGSHNIIGGDRTQGLGPNGEGNILCSNGIGIDVCVSGTSWNVLTGNLIGVDENGLPDGNLHHGIWLEPGVRSNMIGPDNIIAYNHGPGIQIDGPALLGNTVTRNSFFGNLGMDIYHYNFAEGGVTVPSISFLNAKDGVVSGTACPDCVVEIFSMMDHKGMAFEGSAVCDQSGAFTLSTGVSFGGNEVVATATDSSGNTSVLSLREDAHPDVQVLNTLPKRALESKRSPQLDANRIGKGWTTLWQNREEKMPMLAADVLGLGCTQAQMAISNIEQELIFWDQPEMEIIPAHDALFTELADNGVEVTYCLSFWDKENVARGYQLPSPRFKTEVEIERYLDFVSFIVRHFRDRIDHFEIWNEPSLLNTIQSIDVEDYIALTKKAIPVIREINPDAKIVVGGTAYLMFDHARQYLETILKSEMMPLVDVVSWHPMFGTSPEYDFHRDYYYEYPNTVRELKALAIDNGFTGEFVAQGMSWLNPNQLHTLLYPVAGWPQVYSEIICAKYYARCVAMHLGMEVAVELGHFDGRRPIASPMIRNLCTIMSGHQAIDMPLGIDIDYEPVVYCAFRYPNGDRILAVWTDGIAQDENSGVLATITFPELTAETVTGIDVLHGFEQELVYETDGNDTIIRDLLVKDYPILIRLSDVTMGEDYEETVGDGFHRLGEPEDGATSGGGSDRDGDGVPDDEDYCPDWPGSKEANGC